MKFSGDRAVAMMQLEAAKARGEKVSEITAARITAEFFLEYLIEALNGGLSRSAAIGILSVRAGVSRATAGDVLWRVLKKAKYVVPESSQAPVTPKAEEIPPSRSAGKVSKVNSSSKPEPVSKTSGSFEPVPKGRLPTAETKISAPAELPGKASPSSTEAPFDKWEHLRGDEVIGRGFLGEEHRWMTPEEMQKAKEQRDELHRISNAEAQKRRGTETEK